MTEVPGRMYECTRDVCGSKLYLFVGADGILTALAAARTPT
jgi:hypothetical protein